MVEEFVIMSAQVTSVADLYEADFCTWLTTQIDHLRLHQWDALDIDHLIEELEDLGNEQRHAVRSHLKNLVVHLLKWRYQPGYRGSSWRDSIANAREAIADRLETNRRLRQELPAMLEKQYPRARRSAAAETGLPDATFPEPCPWEINDILSDTFFPES
jgi:hypothetical protein